jgi:hypothetical protein
MMGTMLCYTPPVLGPMACVRWVGHGIGRLHAREGVRAGVLWLKVQVPVDVAASHPSAITTCAFAEFHEAQPMHRPGSGCLNCHGRGPLPVRIRCAPHATVYGRIQRVPIHSPSHTQTHITLSEQTHPQIEQQVHSKVSLRRAVDAVQRCGVARLGSFAPGQLLQHVHAVYMSASSGSCGAQLHGARDLQATCTNSSISLSGNLMHTLN